MFLPVTDRLIKRAGLVHTEKAIAWSVLSVGVLAGGVAAITGGLTGVLGWPVIGWGLLAGLLGNTLPRVIQMPARRLVGDAVYAFVLATSPVLAAGVGLVFLGDHVNPVP